jgi:predicted nucleic acid-binding protein
LKNELKFWKIGNNGLHSFEKCGNSFEIQKLKNTTTMNKRVYVDTSVVGGLFDNEFNWQTEPFWNAVKNGEIIVIVSNILEQELAGAPINVQGFLQQLPQTQIERITSTLEAVELASRYIQDKVVGRTSFNDCLHIAIATTARADILVSWNFKHIVNVNRIKGYNSVNMKLGYPLIDIRTPYEVINEI